MLHDLYERNAVLREIIKPLLDVLGTIEPAGVVSSRAAVALHELRALSGG